MGDVYQNCVQTVLLELVHSKHNKFLIPKLFHQNMVIRMTDSSNNKARRPQQHQQHQLRRTKMKASQRTCATHEICNTRAEFKRLKTILASIRRKENVSKLDIILEAIKYI